MEAQRECKRDILFIWGPKYVKLVFDWRVLSRLADSSSVI